jgi:hypothetical protein
MNDRQRLIRSANGSRSSRRIRGGHILQVGQTEPARGRGCYRDWRRDRPRPPWSDYFAVTGGTRRRCFGRIGGGLAFCSGLCLLDLRSLRRSVAGRKLPDVRDVEQASGSTAEAPASVRSHTAGGDMSLNCALGRGIFASRRRRAPTWYVDRIGEFHCLSDPSTSASTKAARDPATQRGMRQPGV